MFGLWGGTYGVNQTQVQRYLACKTEQTAKNAIFINIFFIGVINLIAGLVGLTMYAYYQYCDPKSRDLRTVLSRKISFDDRSVRRSLIKTMQWVNEWDQMTPYLTLEILLQFPGVCGLYMASAFAGTLSTVSSGINGCSTVVVSG